MSEEIEYLDDNTPPPGAEMTMIETFIAAFTKPKVETFVQIAAQPSATMGKGFLWAFVSALILFFLTSIAQLFSANSPMDAFRELLPPEIGHQIPASVESSMGFGTLICGAPIGAIISVLFFVISVALVQWVAKLFGGTGSFEKLFYTFAVIFLPVAVISGGLTLLSAIPVVGLCFGVASLGLSIYSLVLHVLAVQAVNDLDTGKAVGSVLLPGLVVFLFFCCCFFLIGVFVALLPSSQGLY
ncbi:MAG TPA: YIP1 family protein [Anaerolineales bacterium]|nr:YIP1 family protein [Anaerolineales bacterium]